MPTVEAPKKIEPMAMAPAEENQQGSMIVNKQPSSEPRPDAEPQMSLRGGGFSWSCHREICCGLSCNFHRRLC